MKKYFFLLGLPFALAFASCSSSEDEPQMAKDGQAIAFTGAYVDNAVSRVTDNANFDYFQVWGFVDVPGSQVFTGANVTKDTTSGKWSVDETRYWFPGHKYYFTGIGPKMAAGEMKYTPLITWNKPTTDYPGGGAILFNPTVNDYKTDLVYSFVANPTINEPVPMTFSHLLTQVNVAFVNDVDQPMQLWIQNVQINGLVNTAAVKTYETPLAWESMGTMTTPMNLEIPQNPNVSRYTKYGDRAVTRNMYIFPGPTDYTITFDVTPFTDGITQLGGPYHHSVTVQGHELEMGKSYTLVITINPTNLTPDLKPIEFTVVEVESWGSDNDVNVGPSIPAN